ncbi:hypothetical protein VNI00_013585 [Paramarasmius palmivorus]|uniref:Uncharacterized protein n=1 Tax=Paramarasmius palmivorus TaxID=297713 RepID=A0AAW0BWQ1_9AGAR
MNIKPFALNDPGSECKNSSSKRSMRSDWGKAPFYNLTCPQMLTVAEDSSLHSLNDQLEVQEQTIIQLERSTRVMRDLIRQKAKDESERIDSEIQTRREEVARMEELKEALIKDIDELQAKKEEKTQELEKLCQEVEMKLKNKATEVQREISKDDADSDSENSDSDSEDEDSATSKFVKDSKAKKPQDTEKPKTRAGKKH